MEVHNNIAVLPVSTLSSSSSSAPEQTIQLKSKDHINISTLGKINQEIDSLFDKIDDIYLSHISAKQQKELTSSYDKLSDIFSNEQTVNDKSVEKIFNKIDNIFTEAESSLTTKEQENLASIEIKIDELLEKENSFFDKNLNELDNLFTQRDEVLTSTLNSKQKDQLKQLNESLNNIYKAFDNSPVHQESDKQVELLFNKIDSILNASFEQLSEKDKEKVNQYDNDIDTLLDKTLDFNNNEISYLLKKQNT